MKNKILLVCLFLFILLTQTGCIISAPDFAPDRFSPTNNEFRQGETMDQYISRMHFIVDTLARKQPDTLYSATISFKNYLHYKEVEQFASGFGIKSANQVLYAVHTLKGPPPLSAGKSLAEQFQNLKNNLISDYSTETYKGRPLQKLAVQELKEDRLFIGYITVRITPNLAKKIVDEASDTVRIVQLMTNPDIPFVGVVPEKDSLVSEVADAQQHITKCEQTPDKSISWPVLPDTCKR